jgi:hypothetical protein
MANLTNTMEGAFKLIWYKESIVDSNVHVRRYGNSELRSKVYVNQNLITSHVYVRRQSCIKSNVHVAYFKSCNITGRVRIGNKNTMEGKFKLLWEDNSEITGSMLLVRHGNDDITAKVKIPPHNTMEGEIVLRKPPIITNEYVPIKDSYVDEGYSTLNYGKSNILKVGTEKNERFRSFMKFDISDIERNMYIIKATLTLTSFDNNSFKYLELSSGSKEFEEYGITWANQGKRDKLISVENLDGNKYRYEFDVTEFVSEEWYTKGFNNHGFILKSYNEDNEQIKTFLSKESYYPPKLTIQYMDLGSYIFGAGKINANVHVRESYEKDIIGNVIVKRYYDESVISGTVHVHNQDMIESSVTVSYDRLHSKVKVRLIKQLTGNVHVRIDGTPLDIIGNVIINKNILKGKVITKAQNSIDSKVNIREKYNLLSNVYVNRNILHSKVIVKACEHINGSVLVKREDESNLQSNVYINKNLISSLVFVRGQSCVSGSVYAIKRERSNLDSNVIVNKNILKGTVCVRNHNIINAHVNVKSIESISGHVTIAREQIECSVRVMQYSSISGNVNVRVNKTIDGIIHVARNEYKSINGKVKVRALKGINAHVQVNSQFLHAKVDVHALEDLIGLLNVRARNSIDGNVHVFNKSDIKSSVTVRVFGFNDLNGKLFVYNKNQIKGSYAFIM